MIRPVQRIERLSLLLVGLATLLSLLLGQAAVTLGVAVGGALATLNFYALRRILQGLLSRGSQSKQALLGVLLALKFGLLAASIFVIIRFLPVHALALVAGISVVVLSIFVEGFRAVLRGPAAATPSE